MAERTPIIIIEEYNARWKSDFENIKTMVESYIGDLIIDIQHVGSTSVEGLAAKPIIDLDVVIENEDVLDKIIATLESHDYKYQGTLGIPGRHAFQRTYAEAIKYHLYVCQKNAIGYVEHIALRDYLRDNPQARDEYATLKKSLAEKFKTDIDSYCDNKSTFINKILVECGIRK